MLSNISLTCFAASYGVTLGLEISRLFFRLPVRWIVMIAFAAAGSVRSHCLSVVPRAQLSCRAQA